MHDHEDASPPIDHAPVPPATDRGHPPPWIFGITAIPYGIVGGFCGTTMPFLTRKAGISIEDIGWFGFATLIPPMFQFVYSPTIDVGPKRKVWLVLVSAIGGACLAGALLMPLPQRVTAFMVLTVMGQLISGLVGSCNGGLMASTLPNEVRGAAGGWLNAGNLGGGGLGIVVSMYLAERFPPWVVGLGLGVLMVLPALAALTIDEPDREALPLGVLMRNMFRDVWKVVRSRAGWTGLLFCVSPVGTAALNNYFSALAEDFHAGVGMVAFVNGWMNGLVTAAGSLIGGYLCDRMNRRLGYLLSGGLTAVCALVMMACPLTPTTYAVGVTTYFFISGFCYAAFTSVILEAIGRAGDAAGTQYTLFTAGGNFAIAYTGLLDTRFHKGYGVKGLLAADATANLVGIALLSLMIFMLFRRDRTPAQAAAA